MKLNIQDHLEIDTILMPGLLGMRIGYYLNQQQKLHITSSGEGFWFRQNGLYNLLDQATTFYNYPKLNITIDTWNLKESHPEYKINIVNQLYDCHYFANPDVIKFPNEFKVAALLGRANYNRLLFHYNIDRIENRENLIYTFHQDLQYYPWPPGMHKILQEGWDYVKLEKTLPHSDLGKTLPTPIIPPENIFGLKDVYDSVGLEVVIETVDEGFFVTEKTLRPIFYGRPFIVIGSRDFEKNLSQLGFKYNFNFDFYPDAFHGNLKVNFVIDIINTWYDRIDKKKWFESIMPILEHNQQVLKRYADINRQIDKSIVDRLL
jgi:hypothetical protein